MERTSDEVVTVRHVGIGAGWQQDYLLVSDVHFDSPHCDRRLLTRHLDEAVDRGAGILVCGDWFDAMGGKQDRRSSKSTTRQEDNRDNYFDSIVDHSAEYLLPYRDNIVLMGEGNHETAITKHNETNIMGRLCHSLGIPHMGYSYFVRFNFKRNDKGGRTSRTLYGHHGSGGGGQVTKGVIGNHRRAASILADIYHTGHVHESSVQEYSRLTLTEAGKVRQQPEWHVITPGYLQDYQMRGSYQVQRGNSPKPKGGVWLRFYYCASELGEIGVEPVKTRG